MANELTLEATPQSVEQHLDGSVKTRLLNAATEEFAQAGFAGARIHAIAAKAGANKQLIYHYFGSKEQLYNAVLERMAHQISATAVAQAPGSPDAVVLMRALRLLHGMRDGPGRQWGRLLMFEALENDGAIHMEAERRRTYGRSGEAMLQAQKAGKIDDAFDHRMLQLLFLGLPLVPFLLQQMVRIITDLDPASDAFVGKWQQLIEEIYRRLAPETPPPPRSTSETKRRGSRSTVTPGQG